ncbi:MAG: thioredoxin domain-containing protein [Acidobacteria bacterium]|nr:thioredoxin domain-containing protein [Acidobacteriota bacterium]
MAYSRLLTCAACGTQNRIPARYLASTGKCGVCKAVLAPLGFPLDVDEAGFDAIVGAAKVPVLVDFWAEWCGPCKMAAPEVKELAREMAGKAIVLKVDTDACAAGLKARVRPQSRGVRRKLSRGNPEQPGAESEGRLRRCRDCH